MEDAVWRIMVFLFTVAVLIQLVHIRSLQKEIRRLKEEAETTRRLRREADEPPEISVRGRKGFDI